MRHPALHEVSCERCQTRVASRQLRRAVGPAVDWLNASLCGDCAAELAREIEAWKRAKVPDQDAASDTRGAPGGPFGSFRGHKAK